MMPAFEDKWAPYLSVIESFVGIFVTQAELVLSPAYDLGHTAEDLERTNREKLRVLS